MNSPGQDLRLEVASNPAWYHTIDLAPGIVTPGLADLRKVAKRVLPESLTRRRALDVATFDGFWAFEMERRGAAVTAIDVDEIQDAEWPPISRARLEAEIERFGIELGRGFRIASNALSSDVERVVCNVYDLEADVIGGSVDFAFCGALLLHLRDPVRALERIRSALRPGGELRLLEPVSLRLSVRSPRRPAGAFQPLETNFVWWTPNVAGLLAWVRTAGFNDVRLMRFERPPSREGRQLHAAVRATAPG